MSLYFESLKPIEATPTKKWEENSKMYRSSFNARTEECTTTRNASRRLRLETQVSKSWDLYYNNVKLEDRICEIEKIILYAEAMHAEVETEKKLLGEEKFLVEALMLKCDTWIEMCVNTMNVLDRKPPEENIRDDEVINQMKKELELFEEVKKELKDLSLAAWEILNRIEVTQTKVDLNLELKKEVLMTDRICLAINKMDTGVNYKVDPLKGPEKMMSIDEWTKEVYNLVQEGTDAIRESRKLREKMAEMRGNSATKYKIQMEATDYELRKRIYHINREKNECQFQMKRVKNSSTITEMMRQTEGERTRLELFLKNVKDDLKCAETRCAYRFFRPSVDATTDPPYFGINEEVTHLREKVREIERQLHDLRDLHNRMDADLWGLTKEEESKSKSLQIDLRTLDVRTSSVHDPEKKPSHSADDLAPRMLRQLPPPFGVYSNEV